MSSWTRGILKSVWRVWLDTNHGAFAISRRIFDWNLWMMRIFVLDYYLNNYVYSLARRIKENGTKT
jgi:hypothetical protein